MDFRVGRESKWCQQLKRLLLYACYCKRRFCSRAPLATRSSIPFAFFWPLFRPHFYSKCCNFTCRLNAHALPLATTDIGGAKYSMQSCPFNAPTRKRPEKCPCKPQTVVQTTVFPMRFFKRFSGPPRHLSCASLAPLIFVPRAPHCAPH